MNTSNADRKTIRDAEGSETGRLMALDDMADGRQPASDTEILRYLDTVASGEVTGWAQSVAIRAYRETYTAAK